MATGTGHWPGGARRALEGQCLAIPTYFTHPTKPYNYLLFNTYFESSRATPGNPS